MISNEVTRKMHDGSLYIPNDTELVKYQLECLERLYEYNQTRPLEQEKRFSMLKNMFAEIGEGCYIEPPFHSNFGGKHVHFGKMVYANFNLTLVDDTHIYVGDYTMFGPNVTVATAGHPILPELREQAYQYNMSVSIGKCCWIGAGAIILPGVSIGDNVVIGAVCIMPGVTIGKCSIIGANAVVTKDIPSNVVAVGNPCRILREVSQHDKEYYFKDKKIML